MAGNFPSSYGRNTSPLSRAPSRMVTSTSLSTTTGYTGFATVRSLFMSNFPRTLSLGLDLHFAGDLAPDVQLAREPSLGVGERCVGHEVEGLLPERLDHRGLLHGRDRGSKNRLQHRLRRAGRREQALPGDGADAGEAKLLHGGDVGKIRQPRMIDQREGAQAAGLHLRPAARRVEKGDLGRAVEHI